MDLLADRLASSYDRENRGIPRLFARHIVALSPPITSTSVVHDNACGPAVVTSEILSRLPSHDSRPRIDATDISPPMIAACESLIETNNWTTVTATVMDSMGLSFENEVFSHSFTNFLVPSSPGAPAEIYRTLKPGGTALFTAWKLHGFVDLMRRCSKVIRPDAVAAGPPPATEESMGSMFENAGFGENDIQKQTHCEYLPFGKLDDLLSLAEGPFGKIITKDWSAADVDRLPVVLEQVLTAEEQERKSIAMYAWVVIAKKN